MVARLSAVAALALLLAWSIAWGSAALLLDGIEGRPLATVPDIDAALATVATARRLDPFSPRAWQVTGRLQERRAAGAPSPGEARQWLERSLRSWQAAGARQPANPYVAAALARVLLKTGAPADVLEPAFARAVALGRYEPGVQRSLLTIGFGAWPELSQALREQVMAVALDALATDPHAAMAIAAETGQWPVLAPLVAVLAPDDPALAAMAGRFAARAGSGALPVDPWDVIMNLERAVGDPENAATR